MRNRIWKRCQLLIVLGGFGFALGCASEPGPANASAESLETTATTNQVEATQSEVTSEPIQAVPPVPIKTSPGVSEVIKLVQGGVDESVILIYIENSENFGELTTEEITYLRDIGVDAKIISAMIRRGHALENQGETQMAQQQPETATDEATLAQTTAEQEPAAQRTTIVTQSASAPAVPASVDNAPSTPIVVEQDPVVIQQPQQQVTVTYFQETLSPYGTWVELPDYGWTWRPTVAVVDPFWRPYRDYGRWLYTDVGWYWQSDYSWGWAPFHYGRWFRHHHYGWMWHPDTVWGPSWVSWRRTPLYCGWAPLPPGAHYRHGRGLYYHDSLVNVHFGFGLSYHHYTFLPYRHFGDRHPHNYYLPHHQVPSVYNNSTVVNNYFQGPNNIVINKGIDRQHVAALSRNEIKTVAVRDLPPGSGRAIKPDRIEKQGDRAVIYRPNPQAAPPPAVVQTPLVSKSRQEIRSAFGPARQGVERAANSPALSEPNRRPALSTAGFRSVAPASPAQPLGASASPRISRSSNRGVPVTRVEPPSTANRVERRSAASLAQNAAPPSAVPGSATPAANPAVTPATPQPAAQQEHWSQALGFPRPTESRQQSIVSTPQAIQTPSASRMQSSRSANFGNRPRAATSSALPMENRTIVPAPSSPPSISRSLQEPRPSQVIISPRSSASPFNAPSPTPTFPSRSEQRMSSPAYTPRAVPQPSLPAPAVSAPTPRSVPAPAYQRPMVTNPRPAIAPPAASFPTPTPRSVSPPASFSRPAISPPSPSVSIRPGPMSGPASAPRAVPAPARPSSAGSDPRRSGSER